MTPMILSASMNDAWLPEGGAEQVHFYRTGERRDDGLSDEWLPALKKLGFTLLQIDSPFCTVPREGAKGKWDWPHLDTLMGKCKDHGFNTAFFSRWHWPPKEVEQSPDFTGLACLEHGESVPCWSIWSPKCLEWMEKCTAALHERYNSADEDKLDALYMGVQGDYGETMYPQFASAAVTEHASLVLDHDRGTADYHLHPGYWCGDHYAIKSFRNHLRSKYRNMERLNLAWDAKHAAFENLNFPDSPLFGGRRPWLDFLEWYYGSMTTFATENARIARKYFPQKIIMIPTGGGSECLPFGQEETALAKQMKLFNVAIRSTSGCVTHLAGYPYLKLISTACKYYGTPMWLEPPYPPGPTGKALLWGLFEALSCGVGGLMHWSKTVIDNQAFFAKYRDFFTVERPLVDTAVLFPTTNHRIRSTDCMPAQFGDLCAKLRRASDYDVLDERLVGDGALNDYALLILAEGTVFENHTLAAIQRWVEGGGIFLLYNTGFPIETVERDRGYTELFTGINSATVLYPPTAVRFHAKEFLSHAASSSRTWLPAARNLTSDVNVLVSSAAEGAVVWEKPLGQGRCITFAGDFNHKDLYLELARDCIYNRHFLKPSGIKSAVPITDNWVDVFSTMTEHWLYILNFTDNPVRCGDASQEIDIKPWTLARTPLVGHAQDNPTPSHAGEDHVTPK